MSPMTWRAHEALHSDRRRSLVASCEDGIRRRRPNNTVGYFCRSNHEGSHQMHASRNDDLGQVVLRQSHRVAQAHPYWLLLFCTCFVTFYLGRLAFAGAYTRTQTSACSPTLGGVSETLIAEGTTCIGPMPLLESSVSQTGQAKGSSCASPKIMVAAPNEHEMTVPFGIA
jgi:hypothetical protein